MINGYETQWRQAAPLPTGFVGKSRHVLRHIALSTLARVAPQRKDRFLRFLYCHYVFDDQREHFEELIVALKQLGTFIDTDTSVEMVSGRREIDGRYYHLSFDDGFRNVFTNAVPILKRHGVSAITFVPTSLVEADWERTRRYCLETTLYQGVIEMIRWGDLREMIAAGFEVGSHTKTHARLSAISPDSRLLDDEALGSKEEIEKQLGVECKYIAWPYGGKHDVDAVSLAKVQQCSYRACFGAFRETVRPGETSAFAIPRHHFEAQWPVSHVAYFAKGNMEDACR
jgi:peptidoglycan/xylan/chitin deacetylase (PgdA/CDA1 family)